MSYNPNKAALQFTENVSQMAAQYEKGEALGSGSKLTLAIALMRTGTLKYTKNASNDQMGWKGLSAVEKLPELVNHNVSRSDVSKACKVVQHFIPEVITCEADDVVSIVLKFTNEEYGSLNAAYEALRAAEHPTTETATVSAPGGDWDMFSAFATVVRKARKEGKDPHAVTLAFEAALHNVYGAPEVDAAA